MNIMYNIDLFDSLNSTAISTSAVHVPTSKATYQESVIHNTELVETKQTKKRKAVSAANTPNTIVDFGAAPPTIQVTVVSQSRSKLSYH